MCHRKVNNKGFSLVEILVSIVILGIVFLPLAKSFMTAMHANANAKIMQHASLAAQAVMEDFKAEDFEMLCGKYTLLEGTPDTTATYEKQVTSGSKTFRTKITVSACAGENNGVDQINKNKLAKIYTMDSETSCIYQMTELPPEWIAEEYQKEKAKGESVDVVRDNLTRNFHIAVSDAGGGQNISLTTSYKMGSYEEYTDTDGLVKQISGEVKNIYVYFPSVKADDKVTITGPDGFSANLYLIVMSGGARNTISAQVPENMKELVKSNVEYIVSSGGTSQLHTADNADAFITDTEAGNRRYFIRVEVFDEKDTTKRYVKIDSTRGKDA